MNLNRLVVLIPALFTLCLAWDSDDLEVFDVVEEVGQNFYELLDVKENDDASTIKKAFRKLSLIHHPDKSDAPDAEIKFRQIVAVHEILKDPKKRAKYNDVLENGLPDWKQAVYYYRRARKMGLGEMAIILSIIITIGQYLVAWAAYFERKYAVEEYLNYQTKRLQKKQKKNKTEFTGPFAPEILESIPKPSVSCTLPFQIWRLCWFLVLDAPPLSYNWIKNYFNERQRKKEEEEEEESEEEIVFVPRERGPRRRKGFALPEVKEVGNGVAATAKDSASHDERKKQSSNKNARSNQPPVVSGGLWTDDDLIELIRLMKKYPQGMQERWEKIGDVMRRPASEVAHMGHKMKEETLTKLLKKEEEGVNDYTVEEPPKKVKTRKGPAEPVGSADDGSWTQTQQKALEQALAAHPKGSSDDRWEKIARAVPGKTKEECMLRYKSIVELIKKKKENPLAEEGQAME